MGGINCVEESVLPGESKLVLAPSSGIEHGMGGSWSTVGVGDLIHSAD